MKYQLSVPGKQAAATGQEPGSKMTWLVFFWFFGFFFQFLLLLSLKSRLRGGEVAF